uniref:EB domain-containing protein n=1 Tax=Heterorhabditis bacteriophora TaxID=37862 RepID=A0A1I7X0D7_HETBA
MTLLTGILAVQPGNECYYSSQCHAIYPGMVCDRNRCRCSSGMVFSGSKCTSSCPVGYMVNSRGVCIQGCRSNQVEIDGECLDQSVPGNSCVVNAQCTGGSSCYKSVCVCPKAMIPKGSLCVMVESPPLGPCNNGEICESQFILDLIMTILTKCQTLAVPPNSPCYSAVICGGGSNCIDSRCQCSANQRIIDGICEIPKEGQSFFLYLFSINICISGTCQCPMGLVLIEEECRSASRVLLGSRCTNGEICSGGSYCFNSECLCPPGTMGVNGICRKAISANLGSYCSKDNLWQCNGGAYCDTNKNECVCPAGMIVIGSTCVYSEDLTTKSPMKMSSCSYDTDCSSGRVCVLNK